MNNVNIGFREDINTEFKSDRSRLSDNDLIDAVVAFANTNGGDLYIGVEDDGEISGLHKSHQDATQLAAFMPLIFLSASIIRRMT